MGKKPEDKVRALKSRQEQQDESNLTLSADWLSDAGLTAQIIETAQSVPEAWIGLAYEAEQVLAAFRKDGRSQEKTYAEIEAALERVLVGQPLDLAIAALTVVRTNLVDLMIRCALFSAGHTIVGRSDKKPDKK